MIRVFSVGISIASIVLGILLVYSSVNYFCNGPEKFRFFVKFNGQEAPWPVYGLVGLFTIVNGILILYRK